MVMRLLAYTGPNCGCPTAELKNDAGDGWINARARKKQQPTTSAAPRSLVYTIYSRDGKDAGRPRPDYGATEPVEVAG
jgi:hypothetical protein